MWHHIISRVGDGVPALTELNIKHSVGYQGNETSNLVTGANTTNFEFTGKDVLSDKSNYVESKLNFKFIALRMDGQLLKKQPQNQLMKVSTNANSTMEVIGSLIRFKSEVPEEDEETP